MKNKIFLCTLLLISMFTMFQAQNQNLVGAIPGVINVSPMGAVTYTIPIEVVPGTQGMQPNLSIVYNSFGDMGLLGVKWDLVGISAITRCGQSFYFDSNITPIQLGINDRFTLVGERLINTSNQSSVIYGTEVENFTRIFPMGGTYPTHFIAYTDDGSIIEYGNTTNSKQQLGSGAASILSWYINKVTDSNGNTMSFTYWQPQVGEMYISSISYSSNSTAGISSYAGVSFGYTELRDTLGKNTFYIAGYAVPRTRILESIIVIHGNSTVRKYNFMYCHQPYGSSERSIHLNEIIQYGEGGTQRLNETLIKWGGPHFYDSDGMNLFEGYMITGDFNGDGLTDYVVYAHGANQNKWTLFTRDISGTFTDTGITGTHKPISNWEGCNFYKADVNGDGCDELIIVERIDEINFKISVLSIKNSLIEINSKFIQDFYQLHFGDFSGDGSIDFLIMMKETWNNNKCSFQFYLDNEFTGSRGLPTNIITPCKVRVGDFNGNGKTDVEINYQNNDLYTCYFNNATNNFYWNYPLGTATHIHERYTGDFNGDGVADLLTFDGAWKVYFGKGDGSFTDATTITGLNIQTELSTNGWIVPLYKVLIADMDGDGKDDIVQVVPKSSIKICYSKGCVNGVYKYSIKNQSIPGSFTSSKSLNIADFDNDGILDIVVKERTGQTRMAYLNKNRQYEFPKEINDGLGKTLKFVYKPKYLISNNNTSQKYLCHLLDNLQVSNGVSGFNTYKYSYKQSTFSWLRRSFLGFKEFVCTNQAENKEDSCFYELDASKQILKPVSQKTYYNTFYFNEKSFVFSFKNFNNKRYMPYYSETTVLNKLQDVKIITTNSLDDNGRLSTNNTKIYISCSSANTNWLLSETKTYTYSTITLNGNQKKTAPAKILTTQQYGSNGVIIADTLNYGYYSAADKGRLKWMRQGNLDGVLTTNYQYLASGVCTLKTISTTGESPRKEYYEYDNTHRFVTKIKNHLLHETIMTYDAKTGNKTKEIDANDITTTYIYDNFGQLQQINHPEGTKTEIKRNWYSTSYIPHVKYQISTISTEKPDLIVYYDILGREVCRKDDGCFYDTRYNAKGEVTETSNSYTPIGTPDEGKDWRKYTYDAFGRKLTEKAPYLYLDLSYNYPNQSRKVNITDNLRSISSSKDYDALGRITQAQDVGGTINYSYSVPANKKPAITISINGSTTIIISDLWGNRVSIDEPNAGEIYSEYNGFKELIRQMDDLGTIVDYKYDALGRLTQKKYKRFGDLFYVDYYYDNPIKGNGKLFEIHINDNVAESFTYDNLSRISKHKKILYFTPPLYLCTYLYTYNNYGQLETLTYPGGFKINYSYTSTGKLNKITRSSDNSLIYKVISRNKYNAPTRCEYGNGVASEYVYNPYGLVTRINTGPKRYDFSHNEKPSDRGELILEMPYWVDSTILNYRYAYDTKGLMSSRFESVINRKENFIYDNLDRLAKVTPGTGAAQTFSYFQSGNFNSVSHIGSYKYLSIQPHAVTKIEPVNSNVISHNQCNVTYTLFNQPAKITEGDYRIELFYGADFQRTQTAKYKNNVLESTHCYSDKYFEYEATPGISIPDRYYNYHYIYGDNGVVALHIVNVLTDSDSMYYIHTDHLGSYCAITDAGKAVKQRNFFDAWGNNIGTANFTITNRGFTGHTHYPYFKIINTNGRLYDPVIGRFFSPDNFVQLPEFTQAFNRYSYCLNNPLSYIDPSGNTWYDVKGDRRFIDDGIDDLLINVSQRQFNRLERRFNNNFERYESYREKISVKNGYYTFSTVYGSFGNEGGSALPGLSINYFEPGGFSYSERNYRNELMAANPGVGSNILFGERGLVDMNWIIDIAVGGVYGIAKGLSRAAINDGANVVARQGTTVVGEGMKRVSMEAVKYPGSTILNSMPTFKGTPYQITSQMMTYNRQWMLQQMRNSRTIIDIGFDPMRANSSIFYQMERNMMNNYLNLYPNTFQIIRP